MFSIVFVCLSTGGRCPMWPLRMMHWSSPYSDNPGPGPPQTVRSFSPAPGHVQTYSLWSMLVSDQFVSYCNTFLFRNGNKYKSMNQSKTSLLSLLLLGVFRFRHSIFRQFTFKYHETTVVNPGIYIDGVYEIKCWLFFPVFTIIIAIGG